MYVFYAYISYRTVFQLVQRSIEIFVKTKSKMNAQHQFSFMVLDDKASWVSYLDLVYKREPLQCNSPIM